jgi:hypothetical protein
MKRIKPTVRAIGFDDQAVRCYNPHMLKKCKKQHWKRKAVAAATGVFAACSVALASLVSSPSDLFDGAAISSEMQQGRLGGRALAQSGQQRPEQVGPSSRAPAGLFLAAPSVVRGLVLLPFWTIGKLLVVLFSALFRALSPVWSIILGVLLNAHL